MLRLVGPRNTTTAGSAPAARSRGSSRTVGRATRRTTAGSTLGSKRRSSGPSAGERVVDRRRYEPHVVVASGERMRRRSNSPPYQPLISRQIRPADTQQVAALHGLAHRASSRPSLPSRLIVESLADHAQQRGVADPCGQHHEPGHDRHHAVVVDLDLHVIDGGVGRQPESHDRAGEDAVGEILAQLVEHRGGVDHHVALDDVGRHRRRWSHPRRWAGRRAPGLNGSCASAQSAGRLNCSSAPTTYRTRGVVVGETVRLGPQPPVPGRTTRRLGTRRRRCRRNRPRCSPETEASLTPPRDRSTHRPSTAG